MSPACGFKLKISVGRGTVDVVPSVIVGFSMISVSKVIPKERNSL